MEHPDGCPCSICVGREIEEEELALDHCDHEDYESDILTGVASCGRCGHRWHQTPEEIQREREAQAAFDEACDKWEMEICPPRAWELHTDHTPADKDDDELPF